MLIRACAQSAFAALQAACEKRIASSDVVASAALSISFSTLFFVSVVIGFYLQLRPSKHPTGWADPKDGPLLSR
jgi:hypothetical protein